MEVDPRMMQDGHGFHHSSQMGTFLRRFSSISLTKSSQALRSVGSFLGVTEEGNELDKWREKMNHRAKTGQIGVDLMSVLPRTEKIESDILTEARQSILDAAITKRELANEMENLGISSGGSIIKCETENNECRNVFSESFVSLHSWQASCMFDSAGPSQLRSHVTFLDDHSDPSRLYCSKTCCGVHSGKKSTNKEKDGPTAISISAQVKSGVNHTGYTMKYVTQPDDKNVLVRSAIELRPVSDTGVITCTPACVSDRGNIDPRCSNNTTASDFQEQKQVSEDADSSFITNQMSTCIDHDLQPKLSDLPTNLLHGDEAWQHYNSFVQIERANISYLRQRRQKLRVKISENLTKLSNTMDRVKGVPDIEPETRATPTVTIACGSRDSLPSAQLPCDQTDGMTKRNVLSKPHKPVFIYSISVLQLLVFVGLASFGGFTSIGLEPDLELKSVRTFKGVETIEHWHVHNIWLGPDQSFFIRSGAVFAPCMRHDLATHYVGYKDLNHTRPQSASSSQLGCCELETRNIAATTFQEECDTLTKGVGLWSSRAVCGKGADGLLVSHFLRPCCYSVLGRCKLTTKHHCHFLNGLFYGDGPAEHCSEVSCLADLCGMTGVHLSSELHTNDLNQWWRFPLALTYSHGVLHLLMVVLLQLVIGSPIERSAGVIRMALLFILCGINGLVVGSIFNPYSTQMGCTGAVSGLLSVATVELIQSWSNILNPWKALSKVLTIALVFVLVGTLPYIDNFVLLGGFVSGFLVGVIVLPSITFGKWDVTRKRLIVGIAFPALLFLVFIVLFVFYNVQTIDELCPSCKYVNCIPYTSRMCVAQKLW